jgi:small-conductance mechanosensitive channel
LRLSPRLRFAVYGAFLALFVTGAGWLVVDQLKSAPDGETWQEIAANLLMLHGGAAMVMLMLLGALVPLHVQRSWRSGKNRVTGTAMVALNALLVATAFGLYYFGSDTLRPWISDVHIGVGLCLPVLVVVHIVVGRHSEARNSRTTVSLD